MGPGSTDLDGSYSDSLNLLQIEKIPASTPSQDLLQRILEHEKNGEPLVITGVDCDPHWHSQPSSSLGVNTLVDRQIVTVDTLKENNASAILLWLETLSLVPGHLLSQSTDTGSLQVKDLKCEHGAKGRPFQKNHCGSVLQHLTLSLPDGSSDIWFVNVAPSIQDAASYLSTHAAKPSPTFLTIPELSSCPSPTYKHHQSVGDLLMLPHSCYSQNMREGEACSISWSRITLRSLELSVYCELPIYRRICLLERYEIRRAIHDALASRTTELNQLISCEADATSDKEFTLSRVVQDLNTLVRLFDEILLEEYCDGHRSLDSTDIEQDRLMCSFCGSCLFLSSFFCSGCSQESPRPVLLCVGCYVEGRSCQCDTLNPVRLGDFKGALQDRNDAVNSLLGSSHLHHASTEDFVMISESFFVWPRVAVFEAASELWRLKRRLEKGKTCTPRGGKPSHPSAPTFLLNCKKCHAAKCFSHILGGLAHASEALLANAADSESTAWHKLHQEARERKEHPVTSLPLVHGLNALDRRVFFGRHFLSTTPLQSDMQLGFYDISTQYTTSSFAQPYSNEATASTDAPRPSAPTPLSRTSSTATLATDTESTVGADRPTRRRSIAGPGPSVQRPKRARSPKNKGSDDDDEYFPRKRSRLSRSSTRSIQATHSMSSIVAATPDQPRQPAVGLAAGQSSGPDVIPSSSQPIGGQDRGQSSIREPALRRRPTRTALTLSRTSTSLNLSPVVEPSALRFFDPLTDMKVTTQPVEPAATPPTLVESTPTARSEAVQLHGSTPASFLQSSFPKSSFLGLGPLLSRGRSNEESSSGLLEAEGPNAGLVPSVVEHLPGPAVTGSDLSSQRSLHRKSQHQSPLFRPPTDPTNSQASGIATASAALTRRDSQEDIEIQRALGKIDGDSLSMENLEAYVDILRKYGALEE